MCSGGIGQKGFGQLRRSVSYVRHCQCQILALSTSRPLSSFIPEAAKKIPFVYLGPIQVHALGSISNGRVHSYSAYDFLSNIHALFHFVKFSVEYFAKCCIFIHILSIYVCTILLFSFLQYLIEVTQ